jgi:hypothetical protein
MVRQVYLRPKSKCGEFAGSLPCFEGLGCLVQSFGQDDQLLRCQGGIFCVQSFVDAGNDDGGVAREFAGSVDRVLVPGAIGKTGIGNEGGLGGAERAVELSRIVAGACLAGPDNFCSVIEAGGSSYGR